MNALNRIAATTGLLLSGLLSPVWADPPSDIDIYAGVNATSDRPNVLLMLDSSANWNPSVGGSCYFQDNGVNNGQPTDQGSKYAVELCALYNVIDRLPVGTGGTALFNVGIMLTNASPDSNKGGYPLKAFTPLTTAAKADFKTVIRSIANAPTHKANLAQFSLMLHEGYLYFKGLAPRTGNINSFYDSTAFSGGRYVSPSGNSCGNNYIILIANGSPTNGENSTAQSLLQGLGGATAVAPIAAPSQGTNESNWGDEYARYLRTVDVSGKEDMQGIITHAVAVVDPSKAGTAPENRYRAYARSVASYGGGNYYEASETVTLVTQMLNIFNQIQAVNSVFASASLPVSVNARGTYLNQIFMGMFRPDASAAPRWRGNVKQYKFALDESDNLFVADATGTSAINSSTGFLSPSAVSYWTAASTFWSNERMGTPLSASDSPDGEVVEKGSVAQWLRTSYATAQATRKVYTCVGCSTGTTLGADADTLFNDGNTAITQTALGVGSASARTDLINWVRGTDNAGDERGPTTTPATTVRPSIHGDVLHSRPAVVNYGGTTGVVVFYGANDGQLHAVNGNQSGSGAGSELWSFVPQEHFGKLNRLRANAPAVQLSTTPTGLGATPRDYFVDGPIGVYQKLNSSNVVEKVIIYVGMRRGGRQLYAFDVTSPSAPKFLWKVVGSSSGDLSLLGQTWSEPRVARVQGYSNPVVIFGGGYDAAAEDGSGTTTMGNAVYVLDGLDGSVVKRFTSLNGETSPRAISRSVAADVTLVDHDSDGKIDRGYAVDLGGTVYRLDFETAGGNGPSNWTIFRVADLSGGTTTGRKFFFPPDAIVTRGFTALMLGSGDREKPLLSATNDHFFQIFDRRTDKGAPSVASPIDWASLTAMGSSSNISGPGCYMALAQGEKVVNAATSIAGYSFFGTNRPAASSGNTCSANLGVAKSYAMPLFCVASTGSLLAGGGLPPSPVAGIVNITRADGTTKQVPFIIGAPNARNSAIEGSRLNPTIQSPRLRRYWFEETGR